MEDKRILLILPYGGVGGMERLALSFYNHYKKKGYYVKAVKFIKLTSDIINFGEDEIFLSDKDYIDMSKSSRLLFNFKAPIKLRSIIKKQKITHSIAFGDPPNLYSSITFTKEFKIGSIHALKSVELSNNSLLSKLTRFGFKYTYKKLDKLVCISKGIKKDLLDNCDYRGKKNLEVIYNPHDLQEIVNRSEESLSTEENELLSGNSILFLGRLSTQKSPWHLVKAFSLVLKEVPDAKLIVIGDGDGNVLKHIENLIDKLGIKKNITFLGRRSNPYKYLKQVKLLALASHYEGTPNVIVEAICLNTPVVSSYCTEGIVELMSLNFHPQQEENFKVESGIITPNLFKGKLGLPTTDEFMKEEEQFAEGLIAVLRSGQVEETLSMYREELLDKFNLERVASKYLENKK